LLKACNASASSLPAIEIYAPKDVFPIVAPDILFSTVSIAQPAGTLSVCLPGKSIYWELDRLIATAAIEAQFLPAFDATSRTHGAFFRCVLGDANVASRAIFPVPKPSQMTLSHWTYGLEPIDPDYPENPMTSWGFATLIAVLAYALATLRANAIVYGASQRPAVVGEYAEGVPPRGAYTFDPARESLLAWGERLHISQCHVIWIDGVRETDERHVPPIVRRLATPFRHVIPAPCWTALTLDPLPPLVSLESCETPALFLWSAVRSTLRQQAVTRRYQTESGPAGSVWQHGA
jgi:hypothetical protein